MAYHQTDQLLHQLAQVLAKFNRTYVPAKDDDSHTNLGYGPVNRRLFSRWTTQNDKRYILSLELNPLTFVLLDDSYRREFEVICLGKTISQVEAVLEHALSGIGFNTKGLTEQMHYELPEYDSKNDPIKNLTEEEFLEWTDLRALASYACHQIQAHFQVREEVRIWPHHFDTGIYVHLNKSISIGFGMAMKDELVNAPYFYYTAYFNGSTHWPEDRPMTVSPGRIIETPDWCGAVLEAPGVDLNKLRDFMREASNYYLGFL
ncbi:MAG: hypothetical protein AAGC47_13135 [Bacteroidota bacterium]